MRLSPILTIAPAVLMFSACSSLVSVNGFAPDSMLVQNSALPGIWADRETMFIIKAKDRAYSITMIDKDKTSQATSFSAQLIRAGSAEILDLVPAGDDDPFRLPTHTPVRIWVDERTLKFAWLDSPWLRENARKQLALQDVGDRVLITAPGEALMKFLLLNGGDDRAYEGSPNVLERQ